jgi:hypothetical protein
MWIVIGQNVHHFAQKLNSETNETHPATEKIVSHHCKHKRIRHGDDVRNLFLEVVKLKLGPLYLLNDLCHTAVDPNLARKLTMYSY